MWKGTIALYRTFPFGGMSRSVVKAYQFDLRPTSRAIWVQLCFMAGKGNNIFEQRLKLVR